MSEQINNSKSNIDPKRVETLKDVIRGLHEGRDADEVKATLTGLLREVNSEEVVAMEQHLIDEGMSIDEIKGMCDLHSQVTRDLMTEKTEALTTKGHPLHTLRRENEAIRARVARMRALLSELGEFSGDDALPDLLERWRALLEDLLEVDKHYARKENILFSHLEKHNVSGPSQVMWGKDDDVREMMAALRTALQESDADLEEWRIIAEQVAEPMLVQVEEMVFKEEQILFPLALEKLTPAEWGSVWRESPRFGFCLVEPETGYEPPSSGLPEAGPDLERVNFPTGSLSPEQLHSLLSTLPLDLTYVDEHDRVAFYSEGRDRVFERTPAVVGRKVQNCHPPKSVHMVNRILEDFKQGRQDLAAFWIQMGPRMVHIRYFALRGDDGSYRGTLEVTQDITELRALNGERRLLQYD